MRVVELFSGIGAQAKALKNSNIDFEILATCDWDINAIIAYDIIHNGKQDFKDYMKMSNDELFERIKDLSISPNGKTPFTLAGKKSMNKEIKARLLAAKDRSNNLIDISKIEPNQLDDSIDLMTYSFPCQDLSLAGNWHNNTGGIEKGSNNRSSLLWQVERILNERSETSKSMPKSLMMENVSAIKSKKHIQNFIKWQKCLEDFGYINEVYTLDARDFGVPQMRVRTYMLSVYVGDSSENCKNKVIEAFNRVNETTIHEQDRYKPKNSFTIKDVLEGKKQKHYRDEEQYSNPNATKSRIEIYRRCLEKNLIIDKNTEVVPTVTTKQDRYPNSGLIQYNPKDKNKCNFRYLTPRECFMLMGFDESDFQKLIAENIPNSRSKVFFTRDKLNRMAGNSICVNVLESLFKFLDDVLKIIEEEK